MAPASTKHNKWEKIDRVIGSRMSITGTETKRVCIECEGPVYTSDSWPDDAPFICDVCFAQRPDSEVLKDLPSNPELMNDAQLLRLCQMYSVKLPRTKLAELTNEARQRGVALKLLLREHLVTAVKIALGKR